MVCMHIHVFMKGTLKCRMRIMKGIWTEYAYYSQSLHVLGRLCYDKLQCIMRVIRLTCESFRQSLLISLNIHESAIYCFR